MTLGVRCLAILAVCAVTTARGTLLRGVVTTTPLPSVTPPPVVGNGGEPPPMVRRDGEWVEVHPPPLPSQAPRATTTAPPSATLPSLAGLKPLRAVVGGVQFAFQDPRGPAPAGGAAGGHVPAVARPPPRGVALLLHGCSRNADDFFSMPEEGAMSVAALERGLFLVAPDSLPAVLPYPSCWHPQMDGPLLNRALQAFLVQSGLQGVPLYGVGISSGGVMLEALVAGFKWNFAGLQFQVSPGGAVDKWPGLFASSRHPRTSFVHMKKDLLAPPQSIEAAAKALRDAGTPVQVLEATPKTVGWLLGRSDAMGLSQADVSLMLKVMQSWHYLEARGKACAAETPDEADAAKAAAAWMAAAKSGTPPPTEAFTASVAVGGGEAVSRDLCLKYFKADGVSVKLEMLVPGLSQRIIAADKAFKEEVRVMEGVHSPTFEHFERSLDFMLGVRDE